MEHELEVKIIGLEIENLMERAVLLGAQKIAHEYQINYIIDSSNYDLIEADSYLRIRQINDIHNNIKRNELTFKKKIPNTSLRENYEYTVEIDNIDNMLKIMENIKLDKVISGKKERISYELMGARLDFDFWNKETYPYPYLEIEVKDEEKLNEILMKMKISKEAISRKSISQLQEELRRDHDPV